MGKNGVLVADKNGDVYHLRLDNSEIAHSLKGIILQRDDSTNGAGDHFAAAVTAYEAQGMETKTACIYAQINSLRFIGYRGDIGVEDFVVRPVNKSRLSRQMTRRELPATTSRLKRVEDAA